MKKRNEGYALPFVLVVMVVLCAVAVAILSASLKNLQSQQAVTEKMQAQYEAQGAIEKVIAVLESKQKLEGFGKSFLTAEFQDGVKFEEPYDETENGVTAVKFKVVAESGTVQIECVLAISGTVEKDTSTGLYNITSPQISYSSYIIGTAEGGGDE